MSRSMIGVVVLVVGVGAVEALDEVCTGFGLVPDPEVDVLEGAVVREADRDTAVVVVEPRGVDVPVVAVLAVCEVNEVPALVGPSAAPDEESGRMKANETSAVSPPIHRSTSDGSGFQLASRPTARRCDRNSRR